MKELGQVCLSAEQGIRSEASLKIQIGICQTVICLLWYFQAGLKES